MNRDEAIAIIRKEYLCVDRDCDIDRSCGKCDLMMPSKEPILEAYKMAIKALDQEPKTDSWSIKDVADTFKKHGLIREQEPCEDAIDRAEAIKIASGYCHPANVAKELAKLPSVNPRPCEDAISRQYLIDIATKDGAYDYVSAQEIANAPSVNPQPKTGHWEQYGNFWEDKFKCSECGKEQPKILCGERIIGHWSDYCPNCGCRMVEPQERSDNE